MIDKKETTNQIVVVSMLQNQSYRYSSHGSIIKFIGFEPIYYVINASSLFVCRILFPSVGIMVV